MDSLHKKIKARINRRGRGWVFTPKDFLSLGNRAAVDQVLSRMLRAGEVRRLDRGLYDFPGTHPVLGLLAPDPDKIAQALARCTGDSIQVSGARAANLLGLSTQVPAKLEYLTTGPAKTRKIGRQEIRLKRMPASIPKGLVTGAALVLSALLYLGRGGVTSSVVDRLQKRLPQKEKQNLSAAIGVVPDWLVPAIREIAA